MSRRMLVAVVALGCMVGCQSAYYSSSTSVAERLATAERERAVAGQVDQMGVQADQQMGRMAHPTVVAADVRRSGQSRATAGGAWTLAELGDQQPPPAGKSERNELALSPEGTDRGEQYLHKPPMDSLWETIKRDVKDMPHDLWHDTKRVYTNPTNLILLGAAYGGSLALQETGPDDTVEDHYRPGHHTMSAGWRNAFDAYGNPGTHFAIAGVWYLVGQQMQDDKTYNVAKTLASALIINDLTTLVGQAATWDEAPNGSWGTLPSGHTSSSFCIASVMDEAYGHIVGVPMYAAAALVGLERVDDRNHYFSDVVMGAVVGTVIGHAVASGRDPEFFGWKMLPYANANGGGAGVAFMKTVE